MKQRRRHAVPDIRRGTFQLPAAASPRPEPLWSKLLMFRRRDCPPCAAARELARDLEVDLEERDVSRPEHAADLRRRLERVVEFRGGGGRRARNHPWVQRMRGAVPHLFWVDAFANAQGFVIRTHYVGGYQDLRRYIFGE